MTAVALLRRLWWVPVAVALVIALCAFIAAGESADDRANQSIGATVEREKAATVVIENMEKSNEARDEIRDPAGSARYDQCLRTARTPANCERFLPDR